MNEYRKIEAILYNYKKTEAEIQNLKLKIKEIENNYDGVNAISYEEKSAPTNKFNSSVENEVIKKDRQVKKILNQIKYKEIQLEKVNNAIDALTTREKSIIYMKYFSKDTNRNIAAKLNLTEVHICRLKHKTINVLIPLILN